MAEVLFRAKLHRDKSSIPWGFRLQGGDDFDRPLTLVKVLESSVAAIVGLQAGDIIIKLAGVSAEDMTHKQAQDAIINSGNDLEIIVGRDEEVIMCPSASMNHSEEETCESSVKDNDDAGHSNSIECLENQKPTDIRKNDTQEEYVYSQLSSSDLSIIDVRPVSTSPIPTIIISTPPSPSQKTVSSFEYFSDHFDDADYTNDVSDTVLDNGHQSADLNIDISTSDEINNNTSTIKNENTTVFDKLENLKKDINLITDAMNEVIEASKLESYDPIEKCNEASELEDYCGKDAEDKIDVNYTYDYSPVIDQDNHFVICEEKEESSISINEETELNWTESVKQVQVPNPVLDIDNENVEPTLDHSSIDYMNNGTVFLSNENNSSEDIYEKTEISDSKIIEENDISVSSFVSDVIFDSQVNPTLNTNLILTSEQSIPFFLNNNSSIDIDTNEKMSKNISKESTPSQKNDVEDIYFKSNTSNTNFGSIQNDMSMSIYDNSEYYFSNSETSQPSLNSNSNLTSEQSIPSFTNNNSSIDIDINDKLSINISKASSSSQKNNVEVIYSKSNTSNSKVIDFGSIQNDMSKSFYDNSEYCFSNSATSQPSLKLIGTRTERFVKPTKTFQHYPNLEQIQTQNNSSNDRETNKRNQLSSSAQAKLLARRMSAPDAHFRQNNSAYRPSRTADIHFSMSTLENPDVVDIPMPQVKEMVADLNRRLDDLASEHPILTDYGIQFANLNFKKSQQHISNDHKKDAKREKNDYLYFLKGGISKSSDSGIIPQSQEQSQKISQNKAETKRVHFDESFSNHDVHKNNFNLSGKAFSSLDNLPKQNSSYVMNNSYSHENVSLPSNYLLNLQYPNASFITNSSPNSLNRSNISVSPTNLDYRNIHESSYLQGHIPDILRYNDFNSKILSSNFESKKMVESSNLAMRLDNSLPVHTKRESPSSPQLVNMTPSQPGKQTHFTCTLPGLQLIDTKTIDYSPPPSYEESIMAQKRREMASLESNFQKMNLYEMSSLNTQKYELVGNSQPIQSPFRTFRKSMNDSNASLNQSNSYQESEKDTSGYSWDNSIKLEMHPQMNAAELSFINSQQYDMNSNQQNCQIPFRNFQRQMYDSNESNNTYMQIAHNPDKDVMGNSSENLARFEKPPYLQSKSFKALEAFYTDTKVEPSLINHLSPVSVEILGQPHEVFQPAANARPFSNNKPGTYPQPSLNSPSVAELTSKYKDIPIPTQLQEPPPGQTYMPLIPGVYAMFDREFSEKFKEWQKAGGRRNHFQSETLKLVQEMDDERRTGFNN